MIVDLSFNGVSDPSTAGPSHLQAGGDHIMSPPPSPIMEDDNSGQSEFEEDSVISLKSAYGRRVDDKFESFEDKGEDEDDTDDDEPIIRKR